MRTQYHFQRTTRGFLAWDVHRLIELSHALPIIDVPLDRIRELDEPFWFIHESDAPTCRRIAEHAKLMLETDRAHPIILGQDGRVMDGMHRVCRALIDGRHSIAAVRFEADPTPDYVDVSPDELPY